jgi:nucleoside-diphosphate-sugar epimerase
MKDTQWKDKCIVVTGEAGFIDSHLVDRLVELRAKVTVIDDFRSGTLENLSQSQNKINIVPLGLEWCSHSEAADAFKDQEVVFHLARTHGGRGYIYTRARWKPTRIVFDTSESPRVAKRALDISRAKKLPDWEPKVHMEEGLRRTIHWCTKTHASNGYVDEEVLMECSV